MIHLVMPFSRKHLKNELINAYRPLGIILHPIQHEDIDWGEDWIQPLQFGEYKFDPCYEKLNFFKENYPILDEDYYWPIGDDDLIKDLNKIKTLNDDVICVSLDRGDDVPIQGSNCGYRILYAAPHNMRVWYTGLAQIIMKGKIFKKVMYREDTHIADGEMAVYVKDNFDVHYEPDVFVLHNYYQPGRWERLGDKSFYEGI